MKTKEEFKIFVKNHPELVEHVNNNNMTWQKFYEMYVLYDQDSEAWNKYLVKEETKPSEEISNKEEKLSLTELVNMAKKVDLDSLQKNINTINKGLALIESLVVKNDVKTPDYTPRPLFKKFED